MFCICAVCFKLEKYPNLYIKNDFKRVSLIDSIKDEKEPQNWDDDQYKQLLSDIKECGYNLDNLIQRYPDINRYQLIKLILKFPFNRFKTINKISIKNFELLFKDKEFQKNSVLDTVNTNPLIEHVS